MFIWKLFMNKEEIQKVHEENLKKLELDYQKKVEIEKKNFLEQIEYLEKRRKGREKRRKEN